eukprot:scaffold66210_cov73-Phaeocystis_antarctica.AAC.8
MPFARARGNYYYMTVKPTHEAYHPTRILAPPGTQPGGPPWGPHRCCEWQSSTTTPCRFVKM